MNVWARCECSVYVDTLCDSVVCVCVCMWYASMTVYMVTGGGVGHGMCVSIVCA